MLMIRRTTTIHPMVYEGIQLFRGRVLTTLRGQIDYNYTEATNLLIAQGLLSSEIISVEIANEIFADIYSQNENLIAHFADKPIETDELRKRIMENLKTYYPDENSDSSVAYKKKKEEVRKRGKNKK